MATQGPGSHGSDAAQSAMLARMRDGLRAAESLEVASTTFDSEIPDAQSEYAAGISPELEWTAVEGAKSYAVIVEDPDAHKVRPFVHWVAYNIPGSVTCLPEGLDREAHLGGREGFLQGRTSEGGVGYFGPRPPEGDPAHHYHFQVFALDRPLDVPPGAERDAVIAAMKGHVLASGELVGTFQQLKTDQKIGAEGTEAPGEAPRSGEAHKADDQEDRDAQLANTFPASDPVTAKQIDDGTTIRRARSKSK
jgi:Raf kinase inhibitor-like YbhB/YbcL family protein